MTVVRRSSFVLIMFLFTSLLGLFPAPDIPTAHAAPVNENENSNESGFNDVSGDAQALTSIGLDNPVHAAIGQPGDVDWFSFSAENGRTYVLELFEVDAPLGLVEGYNCTGFGNGTRKGIYGEMYRPNGTTRIIESRSIICQNNAGGIVQSAIAFTISSGSDTYYIRVAAHSDSVAGNYKLRILPKHGETGAAWDSATFEPNNTSATAYEIQPGRENALTSVIEQHDNRYYTAYADEDWYRFEAQQGEKYVVELFQVASSLPAAEGYKCTGFGNGVRKGLWLYLLPPSGTANATEICDSVGGYQVQISLAFEADNSGTHYVQVTPHNDTVSGSYSIRVLPYYDQPGATWDATTFEPNNRIGNSYAMDVGAQGWLRSTIEQQPGSAYTPLADQDWYRFEAEQGETYQVTLYDVDNSLSLKEGYKCTGFGNGVRTGLWIWLSDPDGVAVVNGKQCNKNGEGRTHIYLEFEAGKTGIYHFQVAPHEDTVNGSYSVWIRQLYCNDVTEISQSACETLVTLYEWLDGDNWTNRDGWLDTNTPCSWDGVVCRAGQITGLDLANNNLNGPLPTAISTLNSLTSLKLDGNPKLTGELPADMTRIAGLQTFRFANTALCERGSATFQTWLDDIVTADRTSLCEAVINLDKSVSAATAQAGDTLTYRIVVDGGGAATPVTIADTLPAGLTYVDGSITGGATYNTGSRGISYNGVISTTQTVTITYRATVNANVADGTIIANTASASSSTQALEESASVSVANPEQINTLVLLYYGADNNLSQDGVDVLNSVEQSASNPHAVVLMMLDGPGPRDAFLYLVQPDTADANCPNYTNPTCNGRYVLGQTMWEWPDLTADATALADFISGALLAYPNANQVVLSIIGHGSGISAAGLADQPGGRRARFDPLAGLLVDNSPTLSSLSTRGLGDGLRDGLARARAGGVARTQIDGLYLDACLMGMFEVGYEIRDSVHYLLASPNTKWSVADYDRHIGAINGQRNARQILAAWLANEATLLAEHEHPYTYALLDLSKIGSLQTALNNLSDALIDTLPTDKSRIKAAFDAADFFDSNGDYNLSPADDTYVDLGSLTQALDSQFSTNTAVQTWLQAVDTALAQVVLARDHLNGKPHMAPETTWEWQAFSGLSVYAPLAKDGWQRRYYTGRHFQSAGDGQWNALLAAYWGSEPPLVPGSSALPLPRLVPSFDPESESTFIYLPLVRR